VAVELWVWGGFVAFIIAMLLLDLLVFHRRAHVVTIREALAWTAFWIGLAIAFGFGVWLWQGPEKGLEYFTGYVIEKSLSVDNLFVFLLIFSYFSVPQRDEHKVLFWGILGALVFRAIFIFLGVALIERFHWVLYIFGGVLVFTAVRMVIRRDQEIHPERNPVLRVFRRFVRITPDYSEDKFLVRRNGAWFATPLLVVLLVVETTDIIFAIDSVPAIFAITVDPFIVFTSNVFAILGLRALYFALENALQRLRYLHYGLAAVLAFVGAKIFVADFYTVPVVYALGVVGLVLLITTVASLQKTRDEARSAKPAPRLPQDAHPHGPQPMTERPDQPREPGGAERTEFSEEK
jgi:tellurite resistance protein TerC